MTSRTLPHADRRRRRGRPARIERTGRELTLLRTLSGWAIADREDRILFEAPGARSRTECLDFASRMGAVAVRDAH
ncbi:MAG TPA: hypothetical protein VFN48_04015 [Solirubrobacteraceae bacterium]|nr:hypothetical protein [Solirubrobacteraceae bacterium]